MTPNPAPEAPTTTAASPPPSPVRKLDPRALAQALAGIRSDSQRQPEVFLEDTVVPHGGE